jgi:ATP synthase F1 gamma subunit
MGQRTSIQKFAPVLTTAPARNMAGFKELKKRMEAVKVIGKMTSAMQLVATSKLRKAQENLFTARSWAEGIEENCMLPDMEEHKAVMAENKEGRHLLSVPIAADRGLCGSCNSYVTKKIKEGLKTWEKEGSNASLQVVTFGEKAKSGLERLVNENFAHTFSGYGGLKELNFVQSNIMADVVLKLEYDEIELVYNKFKNVVTFETTVVTYPKYHAETASRSMIPPYSLVGDIGFLQNLYEYKFGVMMYHYLREAYASEISARMNAMSNSSKAAKDMHASLSLTYNRQRQAAVTTAMIEIISGSLAVEEE